MPDADGFGTPGGILRWRVAAAILVAGAAFSWLVIAMSFDPLFVAGGTEPTTIRGPALGAWGTALGTAALLAPAACGPGRMRLLLLLWLLFLAIATHRLVERPDGRVDDIWLTLTVQSLPADPTGEPPTPRCRIGRWLARCVDPATGTLVTPTLLPFVALSPGRWEETGA